MATYRDLTEKLRLLNEKMEKLAPDDPQRAAVDKEIVAILREIDDLRPEPEKPES
jgi:hypothetical protein